MPRPTRSAAARAVRPTALRRHRTPPRTVRAARGGQRRVAAATPAAAASARPAALPLPPGRAPGAGAGFSAHLAHAVELAAPLAHGGCPAPAISTAAAPSRAEIAGWVRFLPGGWRRLWPALRRSAAQVARRPRRELRMAEMLTLSEKRFLAVVRYGETQFLIGGAQNSIALLSRIEPAAAGAGPGVAHPAMFR